MSGRKVKTNRDIVWFNNFRNDLHCVISERNLIIVHIGHSADYEPVQLFKIAISSEVLHHTVDVIQVLVQIFNKKDRKSTRLNSSHVKISYAVSCLKKKN